MRRIVMVTLLSLCAVPALAQYPGWAVHDAEITTSAGTYRIDTVTHFTWRYHWDKSDWSKQVGSQAFVSTNAFKGMTIENALQSITYDVVDGNWVDVQFNIIVQDGGGARAVISPAQRTPTWAGFNVGTVTNDFSILVAEPNWTGPVGEAVADWDDIRSLVIAEGPSPVLPDTLDGWASGPGDWVYRPQNWTDWALQSGMPKAEKGGVLIVFGQTKNDKLVWTSIENLRVNGQLVEVVTRPRGSTYAATQVTETSALLQGGIVADGGRECAGRFHVWREGHEDEVFMTDWQEELWNWGDVLIRVEDLRPGTLYHYMLEVKNEFGRDVRVDAAREFLTEGEPLPDAMLVAHYVFDGNAVDVSGQGNHGLVVGEPNFVMDMIGGLARPALSLNGQIDSVQIPRSVERDWTLALWLRTDLPLRDGPGDPGHFGNGFGLINGDVPGPADDFGLSFQSGALSYGVGAAGGLGTTLVAVNALLDTEWHHVAATREAESGFMALYLDGAAATNVVPNPQVPGAVIEMPVQGFGPTGVKAAPQFLMIGGVNFEAGKFLLGDVADARLYNYALDVNEVAALAGLLSVQPLQNLIAVADPGSGLPLTALALDSIPASSLVLGTTTFAGPPMHAQFPPAAADDFNLDTPASADNQAYVRTVFAAPVTAVFLLERGANDSGMIQALDVQGDPLGDPVAFSPADFLDTGFKFLNQTGGGLRVNARAPIYGLEITPLPGASLGVDPVCVAGVPALP